MDKIKIGMISFAHSHANSYFQELIHRQDVEIVGIADENQSRVVKLTEKYLIPYFSDYSELLQADVQAVVICSENAYHAPITMDAARAGKHVLVEKPLGIHPEEMRQMIDTCSEYGVQLMTAFPCRYLPAVIQAKEAIDRGEIGEILAVKGTNRGTMPGSWFVDPALSGGGAVIDHTVHVMDLLNWFIGSKVTEVYAEAGTLFYDLPVEDAAMVHVRFENGVVGVIDTSWSRPKSFPFWGDVTLEIIGTGGVLSVDAFAQKNEVFSDEKMKAQWSYWGDKMDRYMIQAFVRALQEGKPVPTNGKDGFHSTVVALAAYESIRRNEPVSLNNPFYTYS